MAYYARNRAREIERVVTRQRATVEWLRDLRRVPCPDCGGTFPPHVMDFDHRDPKAKLFSLAADNDYLKNRALLEAEVAKCQAAHQSLSEQFAERSVEKIYFAVVRGVADEEGRADAMKERAFVMRCVARYDLSGTQECLRSVAATVTRIPPSSMPE